MFIEYLKAIIFGIVEGITEWLPVSSTGHLILLEELLPLNVGATLGARFADEYFSMFEVVIQLGAILAVVVMFFGKLNPFSRFKSSEEKKSTWLLWGKVLVASIPAALIGIVVDSIIESETGKDIDGWIYNWATVAATLILYGVLFISIERIYKDKESRVVDVNDITLGQAAAVGCFQVLSIIPGTSRSGSTILGSMLVGISRTAAAEFSFCMASPVMAGASGIKALGFLSYVSESAVSVPTMAWVTLLVGCVVSFAVSMAAIRFLMDFVRKHSFAPFGVYRIALGILVLILGLIRG